MKLVHPDFFCSMEFVENQIETVIIESPQILSAYFSELQNQIEGTGEGQWRLSEKGELLQIDKNCNMLLNPFQLDLNNRKIVTALYNMIDKEVKNSELLLEWNRIFPILAERLECLLQAIDYRFSYVDKLELKDFLKFMNVRYQDESVCFFEKLLDYIRLTHEILKIKLFVLVNFKPFLTNEQMVYLHEQNCYVKYQILLVEGYDMSNRRIPGERVTIIDKDGCVIQ